MNNANASSLHRNAENGINSKIKSFEWNWEELSLLAKPF
jgi:hypothetical protein